MILEVDCGNTLIKWRVLGCAEEFVRREGMASDLAGFLSKLDDVVVGTLHKCRIVSVRSEEETNSLIAALRSMYLIPISLASSSESLAGVTNGYIDYKLLGVDRWLALLGAFELKRSACLVLDLGTAVTADFVDASGMHLGGFICPGINMMRNQLGIGTARVPCLHIGGSVGNCPGQSTEQAVARGTELMLLGFVGLQIKKAQDLWGAECCILLTGGDAGLVAPHFKEAITIPDLVFRGLALACPD